jgi:hypothetical protein
VSAAAQDLSHCAAHAAAVRRELNDAIAILDALPDELGEHVGDVRVRLSRAVRELDLLSQRSTALASMHTKIEAGRVERLTQGERAAEAR